MSLPFNRFRGNVASYHHRVPELCVASLEVVSIGDLHVAAVPPAMVFVLSQLNLEAFCWTAGFGERKPTEL